MSELVDLVDPSNRFEAGGLSLEVRALLEYLLAAREATGADIVCTSTTDHPVLSNSGHRSRHLLAGTDGEGLAIDCRLRTRGTSRDHHLAVFEAFTHVEGALHELIYAYAPYNIRGGRRVPPYATADHRDHVHVSVNRGVLVRWPHPRDPQEAHMLFPGTQTVAVPGRGPRGDGRWPMWGWKPDGSVFCWNFTPDIPQRVPDEVEKRTITAEGATVIGLHPLPSGRFGYYLVTDQADERSGLNTFTFESKGVI